MDSKLLDELLNKSREKWIGELNEIKDQVELLFFIDGIESLRHEVLETCSRYTDLSYVLEQARFILVENKKKNKI